VIVRLRTRSRQARCETAACHLEASAEPQYLAREKVRASSRRGVALSAGESELARLLAKLQGGGAGGRDN
jgi:hypothetical protein